MTPEKALSELWKQKQSELIEKYINPMYASLQAQSISHFLKEGTVSGSFKQALEDIMNDVRKFLQDNKASTPSPDVEAMAEEGDFYSEFFYEWFDNYKTTPTPLEIIIWFETNVLNVYRGLLADLQEESSMRLAELLATSQPQDAAQGSRPDVKAKARQVANAMYLSPGEDEILIRGFLIGYEYSKTEMRQDAAHGQEFGMAALVLENEAMTQEEKIPNLKLRAEGAKNEVQKVYFGKALSNMEGWVKEFREAAALLRALSEPPKTKEGSHE